MTDHPKTDDAQGTGKALFYAAWAVGASLAFIGAAVLVVGAVLMWAWRTVFGG